MATWYAAGTATFTNGSATVTGGGTAWILNVSLGEEILAPDDKRYEITAITADGSLTIDPAYLGSNAVDSTYKIVPVRGADRKVQIDVANLLGEVETMLDGIGAGKLGDGSLLGLILKFAADQDCGVYRDSDNNWVLVAGGVDILRLESDGATLLLKSVSGDAVQTNLADTTSGKLQKVGAFGWGLSDTNMATTGDLDVWDTNGLIRYTSSTTGLPTGTTAGVVMHATRLAGEGGGRAMQLGLAHTGEVLSRVRAATGWEDWTEIYNAGSILGTVSQSAGVPTGAIIERGSNANGKYTRFADGMQICTNTLASSSSADLTWTFPASFVSADDLVCSNTPRTTSTTPATSGCRIPTTTSVGLFCYVATTGARTAIGHGQTAIGRWF